MDGGWSSTPDGVILYLRSTTTPGYVKYIPETVNKFRKPYVNFGNRKHTSGIRNIAEIVATPETRDIHGDTYTGLRAVRHGYYTRRKKGWGWGVMPDRGSRSLLEQT
jgi:hypothetical protein